MVRGKSTGLARILCARRRRWEGWVSGASEFLTLLYQPSRVGASITTLNPCQPNAFGLDIFLEVVFSRLVLVTLQDTWRSIRQASQMIRWGGMLRIGTEHFIDIWGHNWLPLLNRYKVWCPRPSNYESSQILQIPFASSPQQDVFIWDRSRKGEFSVKSTFTFIK